jgi:hypothetical protein
VVEGLHGVLRMTAAGREQLLVGRATAAPPRGDELDPPRLTSTSGIELELLLIWDRLAAGEIRKALAVEMEAAAGARSAVLGVWAPGPRYLPHLPVKSSGASRTGTGPQIVATA